MSRMSSRMLSISHVSHTCVAPNVLEGRRDLLCSSLLQAVCEYLQGVLGVRGVGVLCWDGECWWCSPKVGLSVPGATKGWQPKRTLSAKHWYNGEGRGQTVLQNNPCSSRWRGHQTPSLQRLTLIRFEVSSEPAQLFGEGDFVGCCDFPTWAKLHTFSSQGT